MQQTQPAYRGLLFSFKFSLPAKQVWLAVRDDFRNWFLHNAA
jgi:hypothetical protein